MNCDQVFDILTRGPFPSGAASDESVEAHLRSCHECRQLAEALRPAVELLHEAIGPDEGGDLPGYRGSLRGMPAAHPVAVDELMRAEASSRRSVSGPSPAGVRWNASFAFFRLTATALLGAGVAVLVHVLLQYGPLWESPAASPVAAASHTDRPSHGDRHTPTAAGAAHLLALHLPQGCLWSDVAGESEGATFRSFAPLGAPRTVTSAGHRCCVECHSDERLVHLPAARDLAKQQCLVCHR